VRAGMWLLNTREGSATASLIQGWNLTGHLANPPYGSRFPNKTNLHQTIREGHGIYSAIRSQRNAQNLQATSVPSPTRNGKCESRGPGNASHKEISVHRLDTHMVQFVQRLDIRITEITMVHSDQRNSTHKRTPSRNPS
jgi:hypothetical protein